MQINSLEAHEVYSIFTKDSGRIDPKIYIWNRTTSDHTLTCTNGGIDAKLNPMPLVNIPSPTDP